jgi:hypothetical protein
MSRGRSGDRGHRNRDRKGEGEGDDEREGDDEDDSYDEDDEDGEDSEIDAIAAFLAKVEWNGVPQPDGWDDLTEVPPSARARACAGINGAGAGAGGRAGAGLGSFGQGGHANDNDDDEDESVEALQGRLAAAVARVQRLETMLTDERRRVRYLDEQIARFSAGEPDEALSASA